MSRRSTYWRVVFLAVFFSTAGFGAIIFSRRPSNTRVWAADQAKTPEIVMADSLARIANVRNFHYRTETDFDPDYEKRTYNLNRVESVWLVLTPFSRAWRGPAHSFVTFGFSDSTYLAVSIEARREANESYGLLKGLGRNFELIYVIGEENDLIGKRAAFGDFDVYLYPIKAPPERIRAMLVDMLNRAESLNLRPEFYNTANNNCTSNLIRHVNTVSPGRIPAGLKLLVPGYADDVAQSLGLIDSTVPLATNRAKYRINELARGATGRPDFSRLIRAGRQETHSALPQPTVSAVSWISTRPSEDE